MFDDFPFKSFLKPLKIGPISPKLCQKLDNICIFWYTKYELKRTNPSPSYGRKRVSQHIKKNNIIKQLPGRSVNVTKINK